MASVDDQIPRKGISLNQLLAFRKRFAHMLQGMTTKEVVERIIKPETREHHCSYAELVERQGDRCGRSTRFVSHAWAGQFLDLVATMEHACAGSTSEEWLWLDMFVVRQNAVDQPKDKEAWFRTFSIMVIEIGSVWMVFDRFMHAVYLGRCWCLYEYYTAIDGKTETRIILPPREERAFIEYVTSGEDILSVLSEVNVRAAHAENREDAERIHGLLAKVEGGHAGVDARITASLREWLLGVVWAHYRARDPASSSSGRGGDRFPYMLGSMLAYMGRYKEAEEVLRACVAAGDMEAYRTLGIVSRRQGKAEEALGMLQRYLEFAKASHGADSLAVGNAYNGIANVYVDLGRLEKALGMFHDSLTIYRRHLGNDHPNVGGCTRNIGNAWAARGGIEASRGVAQGVLGVTRTPPSGRRQHPPRHGESVPQVGPGG